MINSVPPLISLESVPSTNDFAQELLRDHQVVSGTCISALYQTSGKGQRGNSWTAERGNLLFSVIFLPVNLPVSRHFMLNVVFSLAVADYLRSKNIEPAIKWPNDILVSGKKICGILLENAIRGSNISSVVAGFGLNLNQEKFSGTYNFPPTSLALETGEKYDTVAERDHILQYIYKRYNQLYTDQARMLTDEYHQLLFRRGEPALFKTGDHEFHGKINGVTEDGMLTVEHSDGTFRNYIYPELKILH